MSMHRAKSFPVLILIMFLMSSLPSARAIEGGKIASGENVVTFVLRDVQTGKLSLPTCSGGLIAPRIVVTAKHCVVGFNSSITWLINEKWEVTYPGADIQSAELKTAKILSIFANPGEFTTTDDIALVVIDREFPISENLRVASLDDMVRLRSAQAPSVTYGYGSTATSNLQTFLPYKIENKLVQDFRITAGVLRYLRFNIYKKVHIFVVVIQVARTTYSRNPSCTSSDQLVLPRAQDAQKV